MVRTEMLFVDGSAEVKFVTASVNRMAVVEIGGIAADAGAEMHLQADIHRRAVDGNRFAIGQIGVDAVRRLHAGVGAHTARRNFWSRARRVLDPRPPASRFATRWSSSSQDAEGCL